MLRSVRHERLHVVPVDRADVVEAHLLEQRAGRAPCPSCALRSAAPAPTPWASGAAPSCRPRAGARTRGRTARARSNSRARRRSPRSTCRCRSGSTSRSFGSEPAWFSASNAMPAVMRAIADHGDHAPLLAELRGRDRHAERGADRGARVADAEGVVLALGARGEGREPVLLLDGVQLVAPARQHLVRIGLVADVPDDAVVRACRRRNAARRSARPCPRPAAKCPPRVAHVLDQELAQLRRDSCGSFAAGRRSQIRGRFDRASSGYVGRRRPWRAVYLRTTRSTGGQRHAARLVAARHCARLTTKSRELGERAAARCPSGASAAIAPSRSSCARARAAAQARRCSDTSACCARRPRRRLPRPRYRPRRRGCRPGSGRRARCPRRSASSASSSGPAREAGGRGAEQHAALDERAGLASMHVLDCRRASSVWPTDGEIDGLAAGHAARAARVREDAHHLEPRGRRHAAGCIVREHIERERLQRVAHENRRGFVEGAMARGPAAAQVVVVHRGQVVVHEAVDVHELDGRRRRIELLERRAERFARRVDEHRAAAACRRRARCSAWLRAAARCRSPAGPGTGRAPARCARWYSLEPRGHRLVVRRRVARSSARGEGLQLGLRRSSSAGSRPSAAPP